MVSEPTKDYDDLLLQALVMLDTYSYVSMSPEYLQKRLPTDKKCSQKIFAELIELGIISNIRKSNSSDFIGDINRKVLNSFSKK